MSSQGATEANSVGCSYFAAARGCSRRLQELESVAFAQHPPFCKEEKVGCLLGQLFSKLPRKQMMGDSIHFYAFSRGGMGRRDGVIGPR